MRRHERARQDMIRDELPLRKRYEELSINDRRLVIRFQLNLLGPPSKQLLMTCLCGKKIPIMFAYRCYECGIFFCPRCASEHFEIKTRQNYIGGDKEF